MYKIGIDIGGTKCAVVLGELSESVKLLETSFFPTVRDNSYKSTLDKIEREMLDIIKRAGLDLKDISSIGISCGGPLDSKKGVIMSPPHLIGWDDVRIVEHLESRYNIKSRLENDANACALAEWKFGAGKDKGLRNVIFLTFGTGFGAGLILDGKLYSGTNGMAGEIGHIRYAGFGPVGYGKAGTFDGFCSGSGIEQLAKIKLLERLQRGEKHELDINNLSAKDVAESADMGDPLAREVYKISGEYLGYALSILIDLLNPEMIIIGSIYARSGHLLSEACMQVLEREALGHSLALCEIVPAVLGDDIGLYAALALD